MVDGDDLNAWLKDHTPTLAEIQQLLAEVLGILVYLHGHQPPVIHRDIKPSNLMRRLDGSVVLIDFGQGSPRHPPNDGTDDGDGNPWVSVLGANYRKRQ